MVIVLLSYLQSIGGASQGGLDRFLFGQAAALIESDVINLGILSALCFTILILFYKEFKITTFDSSFGQSLGFPIKYLNIKTKIFFSFIFLIFKYKHSSPT